MKASIATKLDEYQDDESQIIYDVDEERAIREEMELTGIKPVVNEKDDKKAELFEGVSLARENFALISNLHEKMLLKVVISCSRWSRRTFRCGRFSRISQEGKLQRNCCHKSPVRVGLRGQHGHHNLHLQTSREIRDGIRDESYETKDASPRRTAKSRRGQKGWRLDSYGFG